MTASVLAVSICRSKSQKSRSYSQMRSQSQLHLIHLHTLNIFSFSPIFLIVSALFLNSMCKYLCTARSPYTLFFFLILFLVRWMCFSCCFCCCCQDSLYLFFLWILVQLMRAKLSERESACVQKYEQAVLFIPSPLNDIYSDTHFILLITHFTYDLQRSCWHTYEMRSRKHAHARIFCVFHISCVCSI